ncbi:MAG: TldD/PmbA family protein [Acidobacteria bacterium]|nr:TldD/PmbA family protein [Acidobacteriota bacterium]MBS1866630.1 TldD/PmbA family protein [Acidobacteriota bacterium]
MSAKNKTQPIDANALSSEKRLHSLIQTVIRLGKEAGAEETEVHLDETLDALTRFANNGIHQNVAEHGLTVSVRTVLDGKTSRVTTNKLDEDSLRAAIESSLSLAASQPKAPHLLPMPGKQRYAGVKRFVKSTAELSAADRARAVRRACDLAVEAGQVAAGIFVSGQMQSALGNSRGLFASYRQTRSEFSITMQEGAATSWAKGNAADVRDLAPQALTQTASRKAKVATSAAELAPGKYTVILEPAAVLDLVGFLFYDFSATALEDKRSCFNDRMGKPLFGENISVCDDAYHPGQLGAPFDGEGMPRQRVILVDKGIPRNLVYSRASAKRARKKPTGHGFALPNEYGEAPMNLVFSGGKSSIEEMIASTDEGLLVTRLWYIREVDPYEKVMTGMTRDGLFRVQKGKVTTAARNFRFNQSVLEMLRNVKMMSPAVRSTGEEAFEMVVPAMKINGFQFTEATKF